MTPESLQFIISATAVLITLACAYLGLRLYKRKQWLRLAIIVIPLIADTLLYIVYHTASFFYLAVMLLLCIPFVWPRKSA